MAVLTPKRLKDRDEEFGENATAYEVYSPVSLHKLEEEIAADQGWDEQAGVVAEGDIAGASESNPVTVWIIRGKEVGEQSFSSLIEAHDAAPEPDPLDSIRAKLEKGEALTPEETTQALRQILVKGN